MSRGGRAAQEGLVCNRGARPTSWFGVIDLRGGRAVHAVAGRRSEYRPLRIAACPDGDPLRLALHYRHLGVDGLYVADLDRIVERTDASQTGILRLMDLDLPLWVDAGIRTWGELAALASPRQRASCGQREMVPIVATETLRTLKDLRRMVDAVAAPNRLAVSLDLRGERVVAGCPELAGGDPLEVARKVIAEGVERLIVLDVARVGTARGASTRGLCRRLRLEFPGLTILSGGGVRGPDDASQLMKAGCDHVLAGTWLHGLADSNSTRSARKHLP